MWWDPKEDARIHELAARIEALEAAQQSAAPTPPAEGLVYRVAVLLANRFSDAPAGTECSPFARDVLREVAAWLDENGRSVAALLLEQEAGR